MNWLIAHPEAALAVAALSSLVVVSVVRGRKDPRRDYVGHLRGLLDSRRFVNLVMLLIIVAVLIPGVSTLLRPADPGVAVLAMVSRLIVTLFAAEALLRMFAYGRRFFRDPWNLLDVIAVGLALVPGLGFMVVLRTFRLLRVLRVVSAVPEFQRITILLLLSLQTAASAMMLIVGIVYVEAVIVTGLFGAGAPEYFGSIGRSVFTAHPADHRRRLARDCSPGDARSSMVRDLLRRPRIRVPADLAERRRCLDRRVEYAP